MKRKDMLGLDGVSREEITSILDTALTMRQVVRSNNKKTSHLQGKSIVTLFYENSTRTRMSFELASKYMSAAAANISASASSVAKGETLIDTGVTLDQMGTDVIIIRHPMSGAPTLLAKHVRASVINAGDGMNEHPTQALLDMLTMREHLGGLEGAKVAICGDVMHSRVARSNIYGLTAMGANVVLCARRRSSPRASRSWAAPSPRPLRTPARARMWLWVCASSVNASRRVCSPPWRNTATIGKSRRNALRWRKRMRW
ncbi:MAG: hypothetical protein V8Q79_06560 [Christensenellales bacterium]